jgi:D-glycero-D-manno-heptose 1,7-bisphosphate phosphatase
MIRLVNSISRPGLNKLVQLSHQTLNKALFLDRDGVINVNHGYVHSKDNFGFIDGIFDLVRAAKGAGYLVLIVTNQAGIGRGYYSEGQFHDLTTWMCDEFERQEASVDKVYFSPYHPTAGIGIYRQDEETRKPRPGMILKAKQELNLSLERSVLVGDKVSDIQAGIAGGVGVNILFSTETHPELAGVEHNTVSALKDAIHYLEREPSRTLIE